MKNIEKYNAVTPAPHLRLVEAAKVSLLLAPFVGMNAFAQTTGGGDLSTLGATATSGTDTVKSVVLTLAGVAISIALIIWGARHMKPKG